MSRILMPRPPKLYPSFAPPESWRTLLSSNAADADFRSLRPGILERDAYTCQFCGFQASKWMIVHHVNGNPTDNSEKNFVTICQACNLIIHCGFGVAIAGVVDLYHESNYDQVEVIKRTIRYRAQGFSDEMIIERVGLKRKVPFRMDRDYLKTLTGFITSHQSQHLEVRRGLAMMLARERERQAQKDKIRRMDFQSRYAKRREWPQNVAEVGPKRMPVGFRPSGVLRSTFIHVPGVGLETEKRIWNLGIHTWEQFQEHGESLSFLGRRRSAILGQIRTCEERAPAGEWEPFQRLMTEGESWRFFGSLHQKALYLDIETTGLRAARDEITVICTYDNEAFKFFVRGKNLEEFPDYAKRFGLVVTFNGSTFDLPFLKAELGPAVVLQPSWDIRWSLRRLGYTGSLKEIEEKTRVRRPTYLRPISGFDAVVLWNAYKNGANAALGILKRYCAEDVASLPVLATKAYNELARRLPCDNDPIEVPGRPRPPVPVNNKALRRILSYRFDPRGPEAVLVEERDRVGSLSVAPSNEIRCYWIIEPSTRCKKETVESGKWLLFVPREIVDEIWATVVANIRRGPLGELCTGAKVSTALPNPNSPDPTKHVICVYAPDCRNVPDVMRLRRALHTIGISEKIPFKTDAATLANEYVVHGAEAIAEFWV